MSEFRNFTPQRKIINREVNDYHEHRKNLREDFCRRCGYCNDRDTLKLTYFEIDHFIPKHILTIYKDTDYCNLVYACRSCNNAKRKHWPTNDEKVPHNEVEGWIDPCDKSYNEQFERESNGEIKPKTELGKWMYDHLKLYKPQHAILWNIEQMDNMIEELEELIKHRDFVFKEELLNLYREYRAYIKLFEEL